MKLLVGSRPKPVGRDTVPLDLEERSVLDISHRHPGTQELARWLTATTRLGRDQRGIAGFCEGLAEEMIQRLPDGPELSAGLRKLLEAKDCFVRASLGAED